MGFELGQVYVKIFVGAIDEFLRHGEGKRAGRKVVAPVIVLPRGRAAGKLECSCLFLIEIDWYGACLAAELRITVYGENNACVVGLGGIFQDIDFLRAYLLPVFD